MTDYDRKKALAHEAQIKKDSEDGLGKPSEEPNSRPSWARKPGSCEAEWPADSSFLRFDKCDAPADRICLENDKRKFFCELHGRHKKLIALLPTAANPAQREGS